MNLIQKYITHNPMKIEILRVRRRFLNFRASNTLVVASLALALVAYAGMILLVLAFSKDMPPLVILILQTFFFALIGPSILHATIAGERENRTWETLLVAPLDTNQIVIGKLLGGLCLFALGAALMLIPLGICIVGYSNSNDTFNRWQLLLDTLEMELVSLTFGIFVCAFTVFVSSRCKRAITALGAILGTFAMIYLIAPIFLTILSNGHSDEWWYHNPLYMLGVMASHDANQYHNGLPLSLIQIVLAGLFVAFACQTLKKVDKEPFN